MLEGVGIEEGEEELDVEGAEEVRVGFETEGEEEEDEVGGRCSVAEGPTEALEGRVMCVMVGRSTGTEAVMALGGDTD